MIDRFDGPEYGFLSNFYECEVEYEGIVYNSSEAAFQSAKIVMDCKQHTMLARKQFVGISAAEAKKLGRRCKLRDDWDDVKDKVMIDILVSKFSRNDDLREKLMATGDKELIEGNTWHDNYWGDCKCPRCRGIEGQNRLGVILMTIRDALLKQEE